MNWVDIPLIKDNQTTFSEKDINPIIQALESRTDLLKENIVNESILNGVGFTDIGLENCETGQFVAYDTNSKKYIPANAKWGTEDLVPPGEACVVGVVVSTISDGRGTILTSGIIRNAELITKILGDSPKAGEYYLTTNGSVSCEIDKLSFPIHCGSLVSTGCFVLGIQIPDFRTHTHTRYMLNPAYWRVASGAPSSLNKPEGATYYYNSVSDNNLQSVLRTYIAGITLVLNGKVLVDPVDYELRDGFIWLKTSGKLGDNPSSCLYATNPFVGLLPWVQSLNVAKDNSLLSIQMSGTDAFVDTNFSPVKRDKVTGSAIIALNKSGVESGPVITDIIAGSGISIQKSTEGAAVVTNTAATISSLAFDIVNGAGIIKGGDDLSLIKFPKERVSNVSGLTRIPESIVNTKVKLFMWVVGVGGQMSSGYAEIRNIVINEDTRSGIIPAAREVHFEPISATSGTMVYEWTTYEFDVVPNSLLSINIVFDNPDTTISVCNIGIQIQKPEIMEVMETMLLPE